MIRAGSFLILSLLAIGALATTASAEDFTWPGELVVIDPDPGRDKVESLGDSWCKGVPNTNPDSVHPYEKRPTANGIDRSLRKAQKDGGLDDHRIGKVGRAFCGFPDDPEFRKQALAFVQIVVNQTGLSTEDALKSINARSHTEKWYAEVKEGCDSVKASDEGHSRDRGRASGKRAVFRCPGAGFGSDSEFAWYYDRGTSPWDEIDRLYYVLSCLPAYPKDEYTKNEWTAIGRCGNDVRLLDVAKIDEETKQLPDALRIAAREQVAYARLFYAHLEQSAKPTVDKDPDYKRLLYDVPQAAWKKWEADAKKYQKELDAALKFEDQLFGPSTKAYEGCYKALRPHVQRYVKASKVKSFQGFVDAMSEPIGYVLASSFGSCMAVTDGWAVGAVLLNQIKGSRVWRGPRVAVGFAMLEELNRILEDRTRFPVLPSWVGKEPRNLLVVDATDPPRTKIARSGTYLVGETQGVVKAAKKTRENTNLVVDFKAETWMQPTSTCKSTGEIYKITSYGEVIYKQNCRFTGMRKRSFTPARTGFVAKTAMGIRPNSFIRFVHEAGAPPGQVRFGWPMEVYKTKKMKVLTNVFGFTP